jgi:hypothetical protein
MSSRTVFARRTQTCGAEQAAQGFATERETFLSSEFLAQMVIVEPGVSGASQA